MTAGRMMSTVGAVTLGLAMAGAVPALAQTSAGGNATQGAGTAATGQTSTTGPANANAGGTHGMSQSSMHMNSRTRAAHETRSAARHSRGRGVSNTNPDAQNADIARLNDQSLQAAQQGHTFTPSGGSM